MFILKFNGIDSIITQKIDPPNLHGKNPLLIVVRYVALFVFLPRGVYLAALAFRLVH